MPGHRTPYNTRSDDCAQLFDERQCGRCGRKTDLSRRVPREKEILAQKPRYPTEARRTGRRARDGDRNDLGFALTKFDDAQSPPIINKILWDNSVFVPESTPETQLFPEPLMRRIHWRGQEHQDWERRSLFVRPKHLDFSARLVRFSLRLIHPSSFSRPAG